MSNIAEQKSILEELEKIYKQNEDFLSYGQVCTYLDKNMILNGSIKKKKILFV